MELVRYEPTGEMVIGGFKLTSTGLSITGDPTFEEWSQIGDYLRRVHTGHQWWWGDWLAFGEGAYGERFSQALESTDWESSTLRQYAWIAGKVPVANRLDGVPFGHYANSLASLPVEQQAQWANKVLEEGLTQNDLKAQLNAASVKPKQLWAVISCTTLADQADLEARMVAENRTVKMKTTAAKS